MGGKISVFLLTLGVLAAAPAWAQDSASGRPDELQIIEFDFDHQNKPPAVNLPATIQTPTPAAGQSPAAASAPAAPAPAAKAPSSVPTPPPAPVKTEKTAAPVKAQKPASSPKQEKVITIIGEPETTASGPAKAQSPNGQSGQSDEELLDSLFGPMDKAADPVLPAKKSGGAVTPAAAPGGAKADRPKKAGPKTPAVSPLRPPVSASPSSIKVEKSSAPPEVRGERSPKRQPKVFVKTTQTADGQVVTLFHDEAAVIRDFNPRRRAVIDPHTRPIPPAADKYPEGPGLAWTDYRHWELAVYYWSLVSAGYYAKPLEFATSRPAPINRAFIPVGGARPKNYW